MNTIWLWISAVNFREFRNFLNHFFYFFFIFGCDFCIVLVKITWKLSRRSQLFLSGLDYSYGCHYPTWLIKLKRRPIHNKMKCSRTSNFRLLFTMIHYNHWALNSSGSGSYLRLGQQMYKPLLQHRPPPGFPHSSSYSVGLKVMLRPNKMKHNHKEILKHVTMLMLV